MEVHDQRTTSQSGRSEHDGRIQREVAVDDIGIEPARRRPVLDEPTWQRLVEPSRRSDPPRGSGRWADNERLRVEAGWPFGGDQVCEVARTAPRTVIDPAVAEMQDAQR